jgi:tyrosyl-tRNA synthetase
MSKSLGNYIGVNESPQEIFGKTMSISDELMWRYYELLTDLTVPDIAALRRKAEAGELNPRDIKAELAKRIVTDFHSADAANAAAEEFDRVFRQRDVPDAIQVRWVIHSKYPLPKLLAEDPSLAGSVAEARRLITQGGVKVNGERITDVNFEVDLSERDNSALVQVGKRRFVQFRFK